MNLSCPHCHHDHTVKNGRSRHGHQRYRCCSCGVTFGEVDHRRVDEELKQSALRHYAEGVGLRATERLVGVSHTALMNWVKQEVAGKALERLDAAHVEYVESDELWTYVGSKKTLPGCGGLLIALPAEYSAGRWAIVTPEQPERFVRRFLAALTSATPATSGTAMPASSPEISTCKEKPTPTPSKA